MPQISIIIPCYQNEQIIPVTAARLISNEELFNRDVEFEYIMVDDGSKDNTFSELVKFHQRYSYKVKIVRLTRNFGTHAAVLAGLNYATGDCHVVLCADLQDPPELIPKMYGFWKQGTKLVIANRIANERPWLKSLLSKAFHAVMKKIAFPNAPSGGFDLCLMDERIRTILVKINEKHTSLRYLLLWLGYEYVSIPYVREKGGKSQWTFSKKVQLAIDSIVAFSYAPIRAIMILGILMGFFALGYGIFVLYAQGTGLMTIIGGAYLLVLVLFILSIQLFALGIIGEYVWRGLDILRNRPNYIVQEVLEVKKKTD